MNKLGPQLLIRAQSACRGRLTSDFRLSSCQGRTISSIRPTQRSTTSYCAMPILLWRSSIQTNRANFTHLLKRDGIQQNVFKRFINHIAEEGAGTHKPSPFQKKVLVLAKMYPSVDKVPERVTRNQMKKAMDKFRVRMSLIMVAMTFVSAAVMALIGRKQRNEGHSVTKIVLERRAQGSE